jgi:acyl-CoA thioesterase
MTDYPTDDNTMGARELAERTARALYQQDSLSRSFDMKIEEIGPGCACLKMLVRPDMTNGHGTCHGGVLFAFADSAFAFACNTYNARTVAASASIEFLQAARQDDELTAVASEVWRSRRSGLYDVRILNQRKECIALFRGRSRQLDGKVIDD